MGQSGVGDIEPPSRSPEERGELGTRRARGAAAQGEGAPPQRWVNGSEGERGRAREATGRGAEARPKQRPGPIRPTSAMRFPAVGSAVCPRSEPAGEKRCGGEGSRRGPCGRRDGRQGRPVWTGPQTRVVWGGKVRERAGARTPSIPPPRTDRPYERTGPP